MSNVDEIPRKYDHSSQITTPENQETEPNSVLETTADTKAIIEEHPSSDQTKPNVPSISHSEVESGEGEASADLFSQTEPSSTPEITEEEKSLPNEPSQAQITTEMANNPKNKSDSAIVDEQPSTNQIKPKQQNTTSQIEPSSASEIKKVEKALFNEPSQSQITTELAKNPTIKSDPIGTLKPYSDIFSENPLTEAPKQDPQNISQNEPSSTSENTEEKEKASPDEPSQAQSTTKMSNNPKHKSDPIETLKPDSDIVSQNPSTENPKQDPQNDGKETQAKASKKFSICLPLLDILHRSSKVPRLEMAKQSPAQEKPIIPSKDEITKYIDADIRYIKEESTRLKKYKDHVISQLDKAMERFENLKKVGTPKELKELKKEVTKLKLQITSKHKGDAEERDPQKREENELSRMKNIPQLVMERMPLLHKSNQFESSAEVRYFEASYTKLSMEEKLRLLCFSIFPENAIIKKRLMVYWWIAEGFVPEEKQADKFFDRLTELGFIVPVDKKRNLSVGCYTMHPFVRLAIVNMAEKENFFKFDKEGMASENSSGTFQACLMGKGKIEFQYPEKLHAVFNINEPILDFRPEWFSRMRNLNVLYLGRWKVSATDHIEIEEMDFLDGLSSMDHLRFFSLQGVSRIMELPDSITELSDLIILDLRACHSLESIPEGIGFLKNLTFLDFSECYLLEHMPKGLAMLSNLKVFKGFVVSENPSKHTCSLEDLAKLENLIKLCIYTGLRKFPEDKDLKALQSFKELRKLTIAWGGSSLQSPSSLHLQSPSSEDGGPKKKAIVKSRTFREALKKITANTVPASGFARPLKLEKLEKLDLKSFPEANPTWLMPSSLKALKKLYIRGGKFSDFGQFEDPGKGTWGVETLRLKYLSELEMDWGQLKELFPSLAYLEKVNCPKLSFFPSDGYGVWINKEKYKRMRSDHDGISRI